MDRSRLIFGLHNLIPSVKNAFADSLSYIKFDASDSGYSTLTIKSVANESERTKEVASLPTDPEIFTSPVMPIVPAVAVPTSQGDGSAEGSPEVSAVPVPVDFPGGVPVTKLMYVHGSPVLQLSLWFSSLTDALTFTIQARSLDGLKGRTRQLKSLAFPMRRSKKSSLQ